MSSRNHRDRGEDTGPPLGTRFRLFSGMLVFARRSFHPVPGNNAIFGHYGVSRYVWTLTGPEKLTEPPATNTKHVFEKRKKLILTQNVAIFDLIFAVK